MSLRNPNFRIFTVAHIVGVTGTQMQRIAQDWMVLELSGSAAWVGVTVALQFAPMLLFGLVGGLIADRYSKRAILVGTMTATSLLAVTLAVLGFTGVAEVWHIWLIALLLGLVTVVDNPARQSFVTEMVGGRNLPNAISVNASAFQLGATIGPAVAGILITAVGGSWAFVANAVTCLAVAGALLTLDRSRLIPAEPAKRGRGQLREGIRYVLDKPAILWTIIMLSVVASFAFTMPVIMASYADDVFELGAGGYGLFNAVISGGALLGALLSTRRRGIRLRTVVLWGGLVGVAHLSAALAGVPLVFCLLLALVGMSHLIFITGANSLVQLSSNTTIRGRVMAVYMMVMLGAQAIGGPVMGLIVDTVGAPVGLAVSGGIPLIGAGVIAVVLARRGQLRLRVSVRGRGPRVTIASQYS